jgi:hypothetical protein
MFQFFILQTSLGGGTPTVTTPSSIQPALPLAEATPAAMPASTMNIISSNLSLETSEDLDVSMSGSVDGAVEENLEVVEKVATAVFKDPSFVVSIINELVSKGGHRHHCNQQLVKSSWLIC